ncbi:MAG: ASKHA domain-containing protein [Eubacteriales bacterium]
MSQPTEGIFTGKNIAIRVKEPTPLMEIIRQAGATVAAFCGGNGNCGKCRVRGRGDLTPLTQKEIKALTPAEIQAGYRLACQVTVLGTASFEPPAQESREQICLQVEGCESLTGTAIGDETAAAPAVKEYLLSLPEATLADARGDLERVQETLREQNGVYLTTVDYSALKEISPALRQVPWQVTVAVNTEQDGTGFPVNRLILCKPGDTTNKSLGLAVDLGSTKIAAYLVNLVSGETLASKGLANPQAVYGADIRSRLEFAAVNPGNARVLQNNLIDALNELANGLCTRIGRQVQEILDAVVVGNTAMHHLLLGLPVEQLLTSPFVPGTTSPLVIKAGELGLGFAPGGYVYLPPPVAGYVGSDHLAMILGGNIQNYAGYCLGVDIGTNTEIILRTPRGMFTCSCASGPAFEGGHLKFGSQAKPGSVERVVLDPGTLAVKAETIGGKPVSGICGSGVLSAIAELTRMGVIDSRGRFKQGLPGVRRGEDGYWEFLLVPAAETALGVDLTISQRDIGEIKLAAAAIRAGMEILLGEAVLAPTEVESIFLAGAFGSHINPVEAIQIGMFPAFSLDRFIQLGNAAGTGARKLLVSSALRRQAKDLSRRVKYVELATHPSFHRHFVRAMRS